MPPEMLPKTEMLQKKPHLFEIKESDKGDWRPVKEFKEAGALLEAHDIPSSTHHIYELNKLLNMRTPVERIAHVLERMHDYPNEYNTLSDVSLMRFVSDGIEKHGIEKFDSTKEQLRSNISKPSCQQVISTINANGNHPTEQIEQATRLVGTHLPMMHDIESLAQLVGEHGPEFSEKVVKLVGEHHPKLKARQLEQSAKALKEFGEEALVEALKSSKKDSPRMNIYQLAESYNEGGKDKMEKTNSNMGYYYNN